MGLFTDDTNELKAQLLRVERKLDLIMQKLEIAYTPASYDIVDELVRQGRKIQAIKAYRERTHTSLIEAKTAVDEIERNLAR